MGGMDMTGFRMISTGFAMAMAPAAGALERDRIRAHLRDVDGDDDRHDDAVCRPDDPHLCARRQHGLGRRQPACRHRLVRRSVSRSSGPALRSPRRSRSGRSSVLPCSIRRWRAPATLLAALLLVVAGLYQWTPLKHACLSNCQSPLRSSSGMAVSGTALPSACGSAASMALYCVGCCWALMALLFVGGVMNSRGSPR